MILVAGAGSMGKRRIRCLQTLGYKDIAVYDTRKDRVEEAQALHGVEFGCIRPEKVFICTPPSTHAALSAKYRDVPCFIEAGTEKLHDGTPSATMLFNPLVQEIQAKLPEIGKIINISYHCGQYLPDWHPYEKVSDFYAGDVGAMEMVAFELMWFTRLFGFPDHWSGSARESTEIVGLKGTDTVGIVCSYNEPEKIATIMIDVVSRIPIRELVINGTEKQLRYDLNKGVSEQMYIDETKAFMDGAYPNTLEHSNRVIELMQGICV